MKFTAKTQAAVEPIPTEPEITEITTVGAVQEMAIAILDDLATQGHEAKTDDGDAQQQALQTVGLFQPRFSR